MDISRNLFSIHVSMRVYTLYGLNLETRDEAKVDRTNEFEFTLGSC